MTQGLLNFKSARILNSKSAKQRKLQHVNKMKMDLKSEMFDQ